MRGKSIIEVLSVVILLALFGMWRVSTGMVEAEVNLTFYPYSAAFSHFVVPLLIIVAGKRSLKEYTFTTENKEYAIEVGINATLARLIPYIPALLLLTLSTLTFLDWQTVLVVTIGYLVAIPLLFKYLTKREQNGSLTADKTPSVLLNGFIILAMLMVPIIMGIFMNQISAQLVSLVIWQFVISGFGEEAFYRGYIQTTLNREFGKPFSIFDVEYGWGLIITSLLFAISHILNPVNIFLGQYDLAWSWGVWTFFSGLFFGLVREKTNSLISTGLVHGLADAIGEGIGFVLGII